MKILFVAELGSPHAARWINQLEGTEWEVHLFQANLPFDRPNPLLRTGEISNPPFGLHSQIVGRIVGRSPGLSDLLQSRILRRLIRNLQPDIIHSLGLNVNWHNICLPVHRALESLGGAWGGSWVYSSWGSDLDYYARLSDRHFHSVQKVLERADCYIAECERDRRLATKMGFRGEFLGFYPAFGGIDDEEFDLLRQNKPPSKRRTIFLKGRDRAGGDPVGRAMTALEAFRRCTRELEGYRIYIGQADPAVRRRVKDLVEAEGLDIRILPHLPYEKLLSYMAAARVFIALTVNDGLPSTLVEAMALGAFPLHSDLEPIREWITPGENGALTPAEDSEQVARCLRRALTDDALVDRAARVNKELIRTRLAEGVVRPRVLEMYQSVYEQKQN